jgi:hypothetical protein
MSVQPQCPRDLPRRVRVEIFGREVVATVVRSTLQADAGRGPADILVVEAEGSRYRVPAAEADPVPMTTAD